MKSRQGRSQRSTWEWIKLSLDLWRKVLNLLRFSSLKLSLVVASLTILETVFGLASLYLFKLLIDVMSAELSAESGALGRIYLYLGLTTAATLAAVLLQVIATYARTAQGMQVADHVDQVIHARAIAVDLAFYESPRYFDSLERARQAGMERPAQVVSGVFLLFKSIAYLVAILVMISGIDWRLLPAIILPVIVVLAVQMRFTRRLFTWRSERVQMERRAGYLDFLMTSDVHAKELRMGNLGPYLSKRYGALRSKIRRENLSIERRKSIAEGISAAVGTLVFLGTTGFLILRALEGQTSIGDLVLFVLLFRRAETSGREFVTHLARLYDDQMYLRQLFDFLETKTEIGPRQGGTSVPEGNDLTLRLEAVNFTYPGTDRPTLRDINMEIAPGQVVALVGENGSGKTSLIKLIGRLYDPDEGRITLGGVDIREMEPVAYRKQFSVIFQNYSCYADTVSENIRFGDTSGPLDTERMENAARQAEAQSFIDNFDQGYETPLTRVFDDGQEISVGQWQRLALARAFYPDSDFIVMDEPTSALDPQAEFELFQNFRDRIGGRGALVISHRLSTVRQADHIYVLEEGRIVEHGTHDELIGQNGSYAALFEKQGRNYRT